MWKSGAGEGNGRKRKENSATEEFTTGIQHLLGFLCSNVELH
jgi:hypothetical protein